MNKNNIKTFSGKKKYLKPDDINALRVNFISKTCCMFNNHWLELLMYYLNIISNKSIFFAFNMHFKIICRNPHCFNNCACNIYSIVSKRFRFTELQCNALLFNTLSLIPPLLRFLVNYIQWTCTLILLPEWKRVV